MTQQRTTRGAAETARGARRGLDELGLERFGGEPTGTARQRARRISSVMDLDEHAGRGLLLELPGHGARATVDEALQLLAAREVRVRGPLLVALRGEREEVLAAMQDASGLLRQRGQRPNALEIGLPARSREVVEEALTRARMLGLSAAPMGGADELGALVRGGSNLIRRVIVVTPSPTRAEPQLRAELLVLARLCRPQRVDLSLHGAALLDDLVFCRQLGARAASGAVFGGAGSTLPAASALHKRLIASAVAIADGDAPTRIHETARDLAELHRRVSEDPDTRDLAALIRDVERSLVSSTRTVARARALRERAEEMERRAEIELAAVLESVAMGQAPRAERIERCDDSYREAQALLSLAQAEVARAESSAVVAEAGAELRRQSLSAALEARRARLARRADVQAPQTLAG